MPIIKVNLKRRSKWKYIKYLSEIKYIHIDDDTYIHKKNTGN